MHDVIAIANCRNARVGRQELMAKSGSELDLAVRQFFQPYVLAFLALAVVFGGFSYGYKLSQYFQHSEVTRASLTRAWVDHRNGSLAIVSHDDAQAGKLLGLALIATTALALRVAHRTPDLVLDEAAPVREAYLFSSLIPFRAPPSTNPSLA